MSGEEKRSEGGGRETHVEGLAGGTQQTRAMQPGAIKAQGEPQKTVTMDGARAEKQASNEKQVRSAGESSATTARCTGQRSTIRQKIIGRSVAVAIPVGGSNFGSNGIFRGKDGAFTLLHEPASEHGGSVLFQPLIEELSDFLAEIGSVSEAREFVGLKSSARRGEKKFPGSLGAELRHGVLRSEGIGKYEQYISNRVIHTDSTLGINGLWKSVQKQENGMELCSGCAGDYEDPDRSAWEEELAEEEGVSGEMEEMPGREVSEPRRREQG